MDFVFGVGQKRVTGSQVEVFNKACLWMRLLGDGESSLVEVGYEG